MHFFVTGASGFIGKRFLDFLKKKINDDDRVYLLLRKKIEFDDKRFMILEGSLRDIKQFEENILQCEYFFHIAANATFGNNEDYEETNYVPTKNIVDIVKNSKKLKNFVFISTIGAFDRHKHDNCEEPITVSSMPSPKSKYGESKLKAELYIQKNGIPSTIIRPTWVYGKNMRLKSHINLFVTMIYRGNIATKMNFPGKVSIIHVDDLAKSLVNCIGNKNIVGKTYFAETESISIGEIFRTIHNIKSKNHKTTKENRMIWIPSFKGIVGRIHRLLPVTVNNLFIDYLYAKDDDFKKDLLGWSNSENAHHSKPGIQFKDGIKDVISTNACASGYWVITGANSGIGLALAKKLNFQGEKIILIDKSTDVLQKEFKEIRSDQTRDDRIIIIKSDLSEFRQIEHVVQSVYNHPIYCLVNNAGIGYRKSFDNLSMDEINKILDVNIKSHLYLTKLLLEKLKKEGTTIVNVASSVAYNPLPNMLLYSSTKAFISNWSESLTYELKDTNKVITFSPSGTNTNFQENSGVKKDAGGKGLFTPQEVADKIISAVEKNKTVVIVGLKTKILLIASSILPRRLNIILWGKLLEKMR